MTVKWTKRAIHDLEEIAGYLQDEAPAFANRVVTNLYSGAMALGQMRYIGRLSDDSRTRRLVLNDSYLLTHGVGKQIDLLRIRHTSRRPLRF